MTHRDYDPRRFAREAKARHAPERNGRHPAADLYPEGQRGDAWEGDPPVTRPKPAQEPSEPAPVPVVRAIADVQRQPIRWIWQQRIPRGTLTVFDGDPGLGKSTISLDIAARMTRGWRMPPASGPFEGAEAADVLLLSAEDSAETTIRPRLEAAGADLGRVHVLDAIRIGDLDCPVTLPNDLDIIEVIIRERGIMLVIVDPMMAFIAGDFDAHKDQHVRVILYRLARLAERTGVAILLVRHLNKYKTSDAIYRGGGSIGIIGAARSALLVGKHPETAGTCVLATTKTNLGPLPASITYSFDPMDEVARIGWGEEVEITADELVGPRRADNSVDVRDNKSARRNKSDDGAVLAAMDKLDPHRRGAGYTRLRSKSGLSAPRYQEAVDRLVDEGIVRECEVTVPIGSGAKRAARGLVRATAPSGPSV